MDATQLYPSHGSFSAVNGWPAYPHSYHGTPAHEYPDFSWSPGPISCEGNYVLSRPGLASFDMDKSVPAYWPAPLSTGAALDTLQSGHTSPELRHEAAMLTVPHYITASIPHTLVTPPPRRTLTDEDRRNMCIYAEEHPTAKQTEIGARFKVDRSTVSKVLRNKDKYMSKDKAGRSPIRKIRTKRLEIENVLTAWAMQHESAGNTLTDEAIQFEAARVASHLDASEDDPSRSPTWLGGFKRTIMVAHDRKDSAYDALVSGSCTPVRPTSPIAAAGLHTTTTRDTSRSITPEDIHDSSPQMTPLLPTATTLTTLMPAIVLPDDLQSSPLSTLATRRATKRAASPSQRPDVLRRRTAPSSPLPTLIDPVSSDLLDYSFLLPTISDDSATLLDFPPSAILRSNSTDGITVAPSAILSLALPSPAANTVSMAVPQRRASDPALPPSVEDARSGLDAAWRYLQARKSLDGGDCVVLGRMMERLKE